MAHFRSRKKIRSVAYRLHLPPESKIHPVFYVSCLKKRLGSSATPQSKLPLVNLDGSIHPEPAKILSRSLKRAHNKAITEVLVQWQGLGPESSTWEILQDFRTRFGDLADKVLKEEEFVM